MSSALISSEIILQCIEKYIEKCTIENKDKLRRIILREMKCKKFWLFGRTLTEKEAITRLECYSRFDTYCWSYYSAKNNETPYGYEVKQLKRLANAAEDVLLSVGMSWILNYKGVV